MLIKYYLYKNSRRNGLQKIILQVKLKYKHLLVVWYKFRFVDMKRLCVYAHIDVFLNIKLQKVVYKIYSKNHVCPHICSQK